MGDAGIPSKLDSIINSDIQYDVSKEPLDKFDKGVFQRELVRQGIALATNQDGTTNGTLVASQPLKQGTYKGTQMALTEMYTWLEEAAVSHFNSVGFDPIIPEKRDLSQKKDAYQWSDGTDGYPPHLKTVPADKDTPVGALFDKDENRKVTLISTAFTYLIPDDISKWPGPYKGPLLSDCEKYNAERPSTERKDTDIMNGKNMGDNPDWYSDAKFSQQHLTGVNPTTLTKISAEKLGPYIEEAKRQGLNDFQKLLAEASDLYIQDYSYFREAARSPIDKDFVELSSAILEGTAFLKPDRTMGFTPNGNKSMRYAGASVCVFQLHADGRLHPLAITVDYRTSLEDSVTIFNKRLHPDDTGISERDDWPWRYAKTCVQSADWARHEIATHLVDTHMVEEAIIVATNRTIPEDHIIYDLLSPHWYKTLPLNMAARSTMVPVVVARVGGFGPMHPIDPAKAAAVSRSLAFIRWSYQNFNFQGKYVPNDLRNRGFLPANDELFTNDKYRNCSYARNIYLLWGVIRHFVASVLKVKYPSDSAIQTDPYITSWCKEIQGPGQITSFPTITTVRQLIDAITMCIHIASPQHTAVNYLQDYYYTFVASKPAALCTELPRDLQTLQGYTEKDLTAALPIGEEGGRWKDWLLSAQLPEMLSFRVSADYNLVTYVQSLYEVNKDRTPEEIAEGLGAVKDAARNFYDNLIRLKEIFQEQNKQQTEGSIDYRVLEPDLTAVSILI